MLGHMLPDPALANRKDSLAIYAELSRDCRRALRPHPDYTDLIFGQKRAAVAFPDAMGITPTPVCLASRDFPASLGITVLGVVGVRPQEQMIRVDARGHVALVADTHAIGDGASVGRPSKTRCDPDSISPSNVSVTFLRDGAHPKPATTIGLRNRHSLKFIFGGFFASSHRANYTTNTPHSGGVA